MSSKIKGPIDIKTHNNFKREGKENSMKNERTEESKEGYWGRVGNGSREPPGKFCAGVLCPLGPGAGEQGREQKGGEGQPKGQICPKMSRM